MKYTQVELPSLHLLWKRDNGEEIVSSVIRTNYPKPSLYFIPAIVKQTGLCEVETIDMKIRDQDKITPYKKFRYGDGEMIASRKGMLFQKLESKLKQTDILGISINPTSWSNIAIDFMRYAKSVNPNMKIIIGGNEAIFRADHYLKEGLADIAIFGEAENSLPEIIRAIKDGSSLNGINGIKYISDEGVKTTGFAARVILDEIPLPYLDVLKEDMHLWTTPIECFPLPDGVSTPMVWMFITRGCMQFCNYCTVPAKHGVKKFRFKSLQRVEKELDYVKAYGVSTINIWDDSLSSVMYDSVLGKKEPYP